MVIEIDRHVARAAPLRHGQVRSTKDSFLPGVQLTIALWSAGLSRSSCPWFVSSRAILMKRSAVLSPSPSFIALPESGGVMRDKSSSPRPSRARRVRSRWWGSVKSSPDDSSDMRLVCASRLRLLRDPEERKPRMGGIRAPAGGR